MRTAFDHVPRSLRRQVYNVPYVQLDDDTGGRLWVTPYGWPYLGHIDPARWYVRDQYDRYGKRLSGGSGTVYRVPTMDSTGARMDLVVKFSRMAQELPVHVSSAFPGSVPCHVLDGATINDPFQEFGLLEELRRSQFGPSNLRILTKRPLAIYSPSRHFETWQLGRSKGLFDRHRWQLDKDQATLNGEMPTVELSIHQQYIYLFQWVRGTNAQDLIQQGQLSTSAAASLVTDVVRDLAAKGFRVLDTKPDHIIVRRGHDDHLLRRAGRLVYALVDFELLQRTEEFQQFRNSRCANECAT
jgi:hypothetical protein